MSAASTGPGTGTGERTAVPAAPPGAAEPGSPAAPAAPGAGGAPGRRWLRRRPGAPFPWAAIPSLAIGALVLAAVVTLLVMSRSESLNVVEVEIAGSLVEAGYTPRRVEAVLQQAFEQAGRSRPQPGVGPLLSVQSYGSPLAQISDRPLSVTVPGQDKTIGEALRVLVRFVPFAKRQTYVTLHAMPAEGDEVDVQVFVHRTDVGSSALRLRRPVAELADPQGELLTELALQVRTLARPFEGLMQRGARELQACGGSCAAKALAPRVRAELAELPVLEAAALVGFLQALPRLTQSDDPEARVAVADLVELLRIRHGDHPALALLELFDGPRQVDCAALAIRLVPAIAKSDLLQYLGRPALHRGALVVCEALHANPDRQDRLLASVALAPGWRRRDGDQLIDYMTVLVAASSHDATLDEPSRRVLRHVVEKRPTGPATDLARVMLARDQGNAAAVQTLAEAVLRRPLADSCKDGFDVACLGSNDEHKRTIALLATAPTTKGPELPPPVELRLLLAARALSGAEDVIALPGGNADVSARIGATYERLGAHDEALGWYRRAHDELDAPKWDAKYWRSAPDLSQGPWAHARAVELRVDFARILARKGDPGAADELLEPLDAGTGDVAAERLWLAAQRCALDRLTRRLEGVEATHGPLPEVHARVALASGDWQRARDTAAAALPGARSPTQRSRLLGVQALATIQLGDPGGARGLLEQALALAPRDAELLQALDPDVQARTVAVCPAQPPDAQRRVPTLASSPARRPK